MNAKRWCCLCLTLLASLCAAIVALVVVVDPYEIYHPASFYVPAYASGTQSYSNAGVAKTHDYDSIIIGTSVTENCRPSVYGEALGGRFVKLPMNGGTARDHAAMMDAAFASRDVRRVVYGLDLFAVSLYYTNQKAELPEYLYDSNLLNDVHYWFNRDVLFNAIPDALSRAGTPDFDALHDSMYFWSPPDMPGAQALIAQVDTSHLPEQGDTATAVEFAQQHLDHNILPYVRAHRDTTFYIFFPPYSMLYWADHAANGSFAGDMAQKLLLMEALVREENVRLYDFQLTARWTENYDLYYDLIHYTASVNDEMAHAMAAGECLVTTDGQARENVAALTQAVYAMFP